MNNPWKSWLNMSSALLDVLLCGLMQAGRLPSSQQDKGGFYLKETSSLGLNLQIYVEKFSFLQLEGKSQSAAKKNAKEKNKQKSKTDHQLHETAFCTEA